MQILRAFLGFFSASDLDLACLLPTRSRLLRPSPVRYDTCSLRYLVPVVEALIPFHLLVD
jgi:hypothetical protein